MSDKNLFDLQAEEADQATPELMEKTFEEIPHKAMQKSRENIFFVGIAKPLQFEI